MGDFPEMPPEALAALSYPVVDPHALAAVFWLGLALIVALVWRGERR